MSGLSEGDVVRLISPASTPSKAQVGSHALDRLGYLTGHVPAVTQSLVFLRVILAVLQDRLQPLSYQTQ